MKKFSLSLGLLSSVVLAANTTSVDLGGSGRTIGANVLGQGSFILGSDVRIDYSDKAIQVINAANGKNGTRNVLGVTEELFVGYGVFNWADVSLNMPLYQEAVEHQKNDLTGWGDLSATLRLIHPELRSDAPLRLSYIMRASLPTGAEHHGYLPRETNYGSNLHVNKIGPNTADGYRLTPMLAWTLDLSKIWSKNPWRIHGNLGAEVNVHRPDQDQYIEQFSGPLARLQAEYVHNQNTSLWIEAFGFTRMDNIDNGIGFKGAEKLFRGDQFSFQFGASHQYSNGWRAGVAANASIASWDMDQKWLVTRDGETVQYTSESTPQFGLAFTLAYAQTGAKADQDFDGIAGKADQCPNEAEDIDGYMDEDGCPDLVHIPDTVRVTKIDTVIVTKEVVRIDTVTVQKFDTLRVVETQAPEKIIPLGQTSFRGVNFHTGSTELRASSFKTLNDVAQSLKNYPNVELEVVGHTDNAGNPEANQALSEGRAKSVLDYLISKGVAAERLKSMGFGQTKPVADNATAAGRELNRRVEFNRIE